MNERRKNRNTTTMTMMMMMIMIKKRRRKTAKRLLESLPNSTHLPTLPTHPPTYPPTLPSYLVLRRSPVTADYSHLTSAITRTRKKKKTSDK